MTVHTFNRAPTLNQGSRPIRNGSRSPSLKTAVRALKEPTTFQPRGSSVFGILARSAQGSPKPRGLTGPMSWYEVSEETGSCALCRLDFSGLDLVMKVASCGHVMHDRCSEEWFGNKTACICQEPSILSSTAFGSATTSARDSPRLCRQGARKHNEAVLPPPPPEPSPSPVSSPFSESSEFRFEPSPLQSLRGPVGTLPTDDVVNALSLLQDQLFAMQRQLSAALAHVQDLTQQVARRGRQVPDFRRSTDDLVIASFDGKRLRFD